MLTSVVLIVGRSGDAAGFWTWIGQTQLRCNDGQVGYARRITLEHDVPNARIPKARKRISALAGDHYKPFWLVLAKGKAVELTAIDHDHAISPQVRLVYEVDPMRAVAQQRIAQGLCVFRITNCQLNRLHINP